MFNRDNQASLKKQINIRSIDFDGCLYNQQYQQSKDSNRLISSNEAFITKMIAEIQRARFDECIFMVGSNRQSFEVDALNSFMRRTDSCFSGLMNLHMEICQRLRQTSIYTRTAIKLDPYLLADTYGRLQAGESFGKAVKKKLLENMDGHESWLFDDSKLTILYAQMHKVASEHPDADIIFDFYEDRQSILEGLRDFFQNNQDLLPNNITLNLHEYCGNDVSNMAEIKGLDGVIDANYSQNIFKMIACAGLSFPEDNNETNNVNGLLQDSNLAEFKKQRLAGKSIGFLESFTSLFFGSKPDLPKAVVDAPAGLALS